MRFSCSARRSSDTLSIEVRRPLLPPRRPAAGRRLFSTSSSALHDSSRPSSPVALCIRSLH